MAKEGKIQIIKYAPPPPELPVLGKFDPAEVSFIGRTNYAAGLEEKKFVFGMKRIDRRHHLYVIGKSGVGKSKLLELLIRQDIAHGKGACLIDPHGDIIDALLDFIPDSRVNDVCLIDPGDIACPVSFNPLSDVDPIERHQIAQGLVEVMKRHFGNAWTPRLEHVFRFASLALLERAGSTLNDMITLLTDRAARGALVGGIHDEMVRRFWETEFEHWQEKFDAEAVMPLVNKLGQFFSTPLLRNIFDQRENKIRLDTLIREHKIILVNLAKGKLGDENSSFLGALFLMKFRHAAMSRTAIPERDREDFYLYIDEFQNIVSDTFEQFLTDARKFGLCITVSHQYLGQLDERIRTAILSSVGSMIMFRVGAEDAEMLEAEMTSIFRAKDMVNLGIQEFYIKMTIDGETHDPFSAETLKVLLPVSSSRRSAVISSSRIRYACAPTPAQEPQPNVSL